MHWRQAVAESIEFDFFGLKLVKEKKPESHKYSCDKRGFKWKMGFLEWVSWRGKRHFAAHRSVTDTCTPVGQTHYTILPMWIRLSREISKEDGHPHESHRTMEGSDLIYRYLITLDLVLINRCPIETYAQIWEVNWWTPPNPRCFVVYKPTIPFPTWLSALTPSFDVSM